MSENAGGSQKMLLLIDHRGGDMPTHEEERWLRKFYEGTFLVKGWRARTEELLEDFDGEERDAMDKMLGSLGDRIGREWAKDNAIRRIDTAMLQQWGETLKKAKRTGPETLNAEVHKLDSELDILLA